MSDRIISPDDWVPVTLPGSAVNFLSLSGTRKRNAGALLPTGGGTITVTMAGSAGVTRTLPVNSGQVIVGEFATLTASSGITALHAAFPDSL